MKNLNKGKFYAVGTGPGDSGYLTLKGKRALDGARIIAVPVTSADEESTAFSIIKNEVDTSDKIIKKLVFSMSRDISVRRAERAAAARAVMDALDGGCDVAMITLGDVSVYSTGTYILKKLEQSGYETEIIAGVPSFCAGAAAAGISLCEGNETLAVVPSADLHEKIESALDMFDNIVIMKAGRKIGELSELIRSRGLEENTTVISNVGLDGEYIGKLGNMEKSGYFTTLIVKKGHKNGGER